MTSEELNKFFQTYVPTINAIQAIGTAATPLVVAIIGAWIIRGQAVHETALAERAKHYDALTPLINQIFAYLTRVGDYHTKSPETILDIKRESDHIYWTYFYLWSKNFKKSYKIFMDHGFKTFGGHGNLALIKANPSDYFIQQNPSTLNPNNTPWQGFTGVSVDESKTLELYLKLNKSISKDLGLRG